MGGQGTFSAGTLITANDVSIYYGVDGKKQANGLNGTPNTGNGGCGTSVYMNNPNPKGGGGGSGIVILRFS